MKIDTFMIASDVPVIYSLKAYAKRLFHYITDIVLCYFSANKGEYCQDFC